MRRILLTAAKIPALRDLSQRWRPIRTMVDRFVAGETAEAALAAVAQIASTGRVATLDHLGEDTTTPQAAEASTRANLHLIDLLAQRGLAGVAEISIKASAIGQALPHGAALAQENAERIVAAAQRAGTTVTLDMEDHTTTDATLALVGHLRRMHPDTGTVLQAALRRTLDDAEAYAHPGSRIRLCKGAHNEPVTVAHTNRRSIQAAYLACLHRLLAGGGYPMIATHDPELIAAAEQLLLESDRGQDTYEFQMLYGVRPTEQQRLADAGHTVRVYVPYGTDWYGYFMRRLAEKPANLALLGRALISRG